MLPKLGHVSAYLSLSLPKVKTKKGKVFLLYAVSMGETKAASALFHSMKELYSQDQFYIVSRTQTGHAEAKKTMKGADGHFILPIDFSWAMKRFIKRLSPDVVIVIESDFWLNLLRISKEFGSLVFLVSGRVSEISFKRFKTFSFFSKRLFSFFDLIAAQNDLFKERFISLGVDPSKISVTGNLKFDTPFTPIDKEELKRSLGLARQDQVVVVGSTHAGEEEALLKMLTPLLEKIPHLKLIFVPRHPERFSNVENLLTASSFPMISYSCIRQKKGDERLILIDAMGLLLSMYRIADLAIVGGSFLKHLNGHNIFEPIRAGSPVLFGPYMSDQKDLVECVLSAKAGVQVSLQNLPSRLESLLQDPSLREQICVEGEKLAWQMRGASSRACEAISKKIASIKKETFVV